MDVDTYAYPPVCVPYIDTYHVKVCVHNDLGMLSDQAVHLEVWVCVYVEVDGGT